jgi:hypothetical protein
MIVLHRTKNDSRGKEIERKLKQLVVAHSVQVHKEGAEKPVSLPYIRENGTIISGEERIDRYLVELERELNRQRMISGDGCYIDPDTGEIC